MTSATTPESEPLPEIYRADLDGALFEALLWDLERHATIRSVRIRGAEAPIDIVRARSLLLVGAVREIQVRYEHEGRGWIDTLHRRDDRVVLVRAPDPERPRRHLPILAG